MREKTKTMHEKCGGALQVQKYLQNRDSIAADLVVSNTSKYQVQYLALQVQKYLQNSDSIAVDLVVSIKY